MPEPLVRATALTVHYPLFKGFIHRLVGGGVQYVHAVDGITFNIEVGEVFGLVGESGCGKSTTGRALMGLAPVSAGEVVLQFPEDPSPGGGRIRPLGLLL